MYKIQVSKREREKSEITISRARGAYPFKFLHSALYDKLFRKWKSYDSIICFFSISDTYCSYI